MAAEGSIAGTITRLKEEKPALAALLDAFGPAVAARAALAERLAPGLAGAGLLPAAPAEGRSLLDAAPLAPLWPHVAAAAEELAPLLGDIPALAPRLAEARAFLEAGRDGASAESLLRALISQDGDAVAALAGEDVLPAAAFLGEAALSAVLRALVPSAGLEQREDLPAWTKGTCPFCGRPPTIAWLAKPAVDERNPYLQAGGGKKHLHCGLCGSDWTFRRAVCPCCGSEEKGVMNVLYAETMRAEHVAWCSSCRKYCVGVDLRAIDPVPDMDAMALGLVHLDVIAAGRGLVPACRSFWNQF